MIVADSIFASIIVKDELYKAYKKYDIRVTVDLAYCEAANVLWKHVKINLM